jgi:hypothetical protein
MNRHSTAINRRQLNRKSCLILFSLVIILALAPFHRVNALGGVTLTAPTRSSVSIDGVFQPNEWADGTHLSFNWASSNSSLTGGGNIWVKTNGTNLLVAVGSNGPTNTNTGVDTYNYTLSLLMDNNNNGVIGNNENAKSLGITYSSSGTPTATYRDLHYDSARGSYIDNTNVLGTAAGSHSPSGAWSWEFSMPLSSNDFTLAQNASIGMDIVYSEQHYSTLALVSSGWAYWQVSYPNGYPTGTAPSANGWADIVWTNLNAPIVDTTPPTISTPTITPSSPGPSDTVTVHVNVTDVGSGVKNVSITYTTDNWKSVNKTLLANYNITTHYATAQIPPLQFGGHTEYYITAFDNAGNKAVNNNSGSYFSYDVSAPWFLNLWLYIIVVALIATVILFAIIYPKRHRRATNQTVPPSA